MMGNLDRLIEWNYAAPPDQFERRRNQVVYDNYQHNRDPFTDHPEWVWSVFVTKRTTAKLRSRAHARQRRQLDKNIDLGRVLVGDSVPAVQNVTLNKAGRMARTIK